MISLIIISSLIIFGLHYSFQFDLVATGNYTGITADTTATNKEILWFVKYWLHIIFYNTAFEFLLKPLCDCVICMSSVYSSIVFWTHFYFLNQQITTQTILSWLAIVVATAGLNRVIHKFLIL